MHNSVCSILYVIVNTTVALFFFASFTTVKSDDLAVIEIDMTKHK
jgi:hypothetical protein